MKYQSLETLKTDLLTDAVEATIDVLRAAKERRTMTIEDAQDFTLAESVLRRILSDKSFFEG